MKSPARLMVALAVASGIGTVHADRIADPAAHSRTERGVTSNHSARSLVEVADLSLQPAHGRLRPDSDGHVRPAAESADAARATPVAAINGIISLAAADDTGAIAAAQRPTRPQTTASALAKSPLEPQEAPVPAGWMTLLCGLVVMAFMASRRGSDPD